MKKIKLLIASVLATFSLSPMLVPATVYAQATGDQSDIACGAQEAVDVTGDATCTVDATTDEDVNNTIILFIRIFQIVIGVIAVVMIIVGGLKYITSGGDAGGIGSAKNTILYALVGLVIVALAEIIVQFVLNRVDTIEGGGL